MRTLPSTFYAAPRPEQLARLRRAANDALTNYDLVPVNLELLKFEHHAVYRLTTAEGQYFVLRLCPVESDSTDEFAAGVAWQYSLREANLPVVGPLFTREGQLVSTVDLGESAIASFALIEWAAGRRPGRSFGTQEMRKAGTLIASLHSHSSAVPFKLSRRLPAWDLDLIADGELWTRYLPRKQREVLLMAIRVVNDRLGNYDRRVNSFGPIHADLNLANFVFSGGNPIAIDFGDCGRGWLIYDLAVMLAATRRDIPQRAAVLCGAYLDGYQLVRPLPARTDSLLPLFFMFRELVVCKWLDSPNALTRSKALPYVSEACSRLRTYLKEAEHSG